MQESPDRLGVQSGSETDFEKTPSAESIEAKKLAFESDKWKDELELRRQELQLKREESSRSKWSSPLVVAVVVAVLGAILAAIGNGVLSWQNSVAQRELERVRSELNLDLEKSKSEQTLNLERSKEEAARILEVVKTADPDKAAINLRFLLDTHLIQDQVTRSSLESYLNNRKEGQGAALPAASNASSFGSSFASLQCRLQEVDLNSFRNKLAELLRELPFELHVEESLLGEIDASAIGHSSIEPGLYHNLDIRATLYTNQEHQYIRIRLTLVVLTPKRRNVL
jgi:hypothetical protein